MVLYRAAGLLTLDNKMQWLQRKVQQFKRDLQSMAQVVSFEVAREDVFLSFWAVCSCSLAFHWTLVCLNACDFLYVYVCACVCVCVCVWQCE